MRLQGARSQTLGSTFFGGGRCEFLVWAYRAKKVELHIFGPDERIVPMCREPHGYYRATLEGIRPDDLYKFRVDGEKERPDPASHFQPQGVHGPSAIVDRAFDWSDGSWQNHQLDQYVLYEIHVGAFTREGTLDAIHTRLDDLKELGLTALELMPVAQFPGARNWGYDGVYPFAVQNSYGGPAGLKRLVNACHRRGLAVVLDVVYNHLGPEGNYLADYGPYFADYYATPWGEAVNFDGAGSDQVRRYFIENALYWITEFHVDALRLDAIHGIIDPSARTFLEELVDAVRERTASLGRRAYLIGESNRNDARIVRDRESGGLGLDAMWNDDLHHAIHTLLTGERTGYYCDFGTISHLAKSFEEGFVLSGQYSDYRRRRHGNSARGIPGKRFVVFAQNHDQIGNRLLGERLSRLGSFEDLKLAAGLILLSPYVPLLFMGEEYGETAPFLYFVSHSDQALIDAVREGRRKSAADFGWNVDMPDPQDESAFLRSKLNWEMRGTGRQKVLGELHKELLRLRRQIPALANLNPKDLRAVVHEKERALSVWRSYGQSESLAVFHFGDESILLMAPVPEGNWEKEFDSADQRWDGAGTAAPSQADTSGQPVVAVSGKSFVVYTRSLAR